MHPRVLPSQGATLVRPFAPHPARPPRISPAYGWWLVAMLLLLNGRLSAQNYVYQRQIGSAAQGLFQIINPHGVAVDRSGNRYVMDNSSIVKLSPTDQLLFQFGSRGSGEGQFEQPGGLAVDGSGNLYVVDTYNHRIQQFDSAGRFLAQFGSYGSEEGHFQYPQGVAVDGSGNLYVTDYYEEDTKNHRVQKFDASGRFLARFGSYGTGDGQFNRPSSIAVDGSGHLFVVDGFNHRVQKFDTSGHFLAKLDKEGSGNGQLGSPCYVAVDGSDNLYVAELGNHRIQKFDSEGRFLLKFGQQGNEQGQFPEFEDFTGLAVDASGNIFVSGRAHVQQFDSAGHFLSIVGSDGTGDGEFRYPAGVTVDGSGNLYVVDLGNHRIQKFDSMGHLLLKFGGLGVGPGQFERPVSVAVDGSGNLYVAELGNHRIQKLSPSGRFLSQFDNIDTDDVQFQTNPGGLAVEASGKLYVVDDISHRIQQFDSSGRLLRDFHNQSSGDGRFTYAAAVALDGRGNVYVTDSYHHFVQRFDTMGHLLSQFGSYGTGEGQFQGPVGIAVDDSDHLFVSDMDNNRIQKFDSTGRFLLQFGSKGTGNGQFQGPFGVAVDVRGHVYVADLSNNRVQVFSSAPCPSLTFVHANGANLPPAIVGQTYQQALTADAAGYIFTASGLPAGLSISAEGLISGIPTVVGTFPDTVSVTATKGTCQVKVSYSLVVNQAQLGQVVSFTLVDARTGKDLRPLSEGDVLNLLALPKQLSVRANTAPAEVGSVVFGLNNKPDFRVENFAPYALASNNADDSYVPYPFRVGEYTLSATPYGQINGQGEKGSPFTVHFQVVYPKVVGFTLINATTGGEIRPLKDGEVLDLANLPAHLSIRANTEPWQVGSVGFDVNGKAAVRKENTLPYALASNKPANRLLFLSQFGREGSEVGQFRDLQGLAVDGSGNVYVTDAGNHRVQKFSASGRFLFQFGSLGSGGSGEGEFLDPWGVAVDGNHVYVTDHNTHRVQKFSSAGTYLSQFGSYGSGAGQFRNPTGVAVDGHGNVYVADLINNRIQQFDSAGTYLAQFGSPGSGEGQFNGPISVAVDGRGDLYVEDMGNNRLQKFDSTGRFLAQIGRGGTHEGQFIEPRGVAVDGSGNLYVADNKKPPHPAARLLGSFPELGGGLRDRKWAVPVSVRRGPGRLG